MGGRSSGWGCSGTTPSSTALAGGGGRAWWLYRTRFGLRLRAAGENPAMVDAAGVSVLKLRYQALMLNGVLSALAVLPGAGADAQLHPQHDRRSRRYMALAAMIFGKWHPLAPALPACCSASSKRRHPPAGRLVPPGAGAGAGHPGPALPDDGGAAGRFRAGVRSTRAWALPRQGTVKER